VSRRPAELDRRGRMIRESARLFRERGYEGASVRDIAAATGLQSGSWVYHFKTKQDILAAVMEEGLRHSLERIEAIGAEPLAPREKFRALVRAHLETILSPGQDFIPVLLYDWRSLEPTARPRVVALQKRYEAVWGRVIAQLHASGDWAAPTRVDRLLMFGALNWMAHWFHHGGRFDMAELAEEAVRFFLRTPRRGGRRATAPRQSKAPARARPRPRS
jgi:TetR/AcrR family transcriptional regulator, cholesterol catabolism regulator